MTERKKALLAASGLVAALVLAAEVPAEDATEEPGSVAVEGATLGRMGEPVAVDPAEYQFATAEAKLWLSDHLRNISLPGRLYYEFVKRGSYEEGFTDAVYLDITQINEDGSKNASLEFFTAERAQKTAGADNLTHITGNPVLVVYMQGDVYEMNRLTNGNWRHFQRRIKLAFSESAEIEPVTFEYGGKLVAGEKISIKPYLTDPRRGQFEQFARKVYEFVLSDQVPGTLYQIKTVIPDNLPDREPLIEEVLTLQHADFKS